MHQHESSPYTIDENPGPGVVDGSYFQTPYFYANSNSTSGHPVSGESTWSNSLAHVKDFGADISSRVGHQVAPRGSQISPSTRRDWHQGYDGHNASHMDGAHSYRHRQAANTPRSQSRGVIHVPEIMGPSVPQGSSDNVPLSTPTSSDGTSSYEEVLSDHGVKIYRCSCGKETKRMGDMRRHHQSLRHSQDRKHGCLWCGQRYTRKDGVDRHNKTCKKRRECGIPDPRIIVKDKKPRKKKREEHVD